LKEYHESKSKIEALLAKMEVMEREPDAVGRDE
jgi:hypothetical protein